MRDAPGPPKAGGVHPVREIVVGSTRILVDPTARGAHGRLGQEVENEGRDDLLEAGPQADDHEARIEGSEHRRIGLQPTKPLVPVDDLHVEAVQALGSSLTGLGNSPDEGDAGAILEAFEDVRQDEVRGGAGDLVACCAQTHLQEGPVEADGVHAGKRTEVGVQEGPVVEPRGRVSSGEHALRHRVERGVGRGGADRAGGLGLFRAAGGG